MKVAVFARTGQAVAALRMPSLETFLARTLPQCRRVPVQGHRDVAKVNASNVPDIPSYSHYPTDSSTRFASKTHRGSFSAYGYRQGLRQSAEEGCVFAPDERFWRQRGQRTPDPVAPRLPMLLNDDSCGGAVTAQRSTVTETGAEGASAGLRSEPIRKPPTVSDVLPPFFVGRHGALNDGTGTTLPTCR